VNVTEHVPDTSEQEPPLLKEPEPPGTINDTIPDGDVPVTVTETVVGLLMLTDDGVNVITVFVVALFTVRVTCLELAASFVSPP